MVDVSVVSSAHDVADARLHRIVAALQRANLAVELLGLGDAAAGPPSAQVIGLGARPTRLRRALLAWQLPRRASGRVLLTVDPELAAPAWIATRRRGRSWVADVHEDYLALLDDRQWARGARGVLGRLIARLATWLVARADLTLVADEHVPPADARKRLVVRNLPRLEELPRPSPRDAHPRAVYIGDVRRSRGLAFMLDAVEGAPGWQLDVVGPVAPAEREWLDARLQRWSSPVPPVFHGRLPMSEAWALAAGAWCGFAVLEDTPAFRAAMPTKLYEYLAAGLAVLVTPLPRMAALVEASGAGEVVTDATHASATLRGWQDEPEAAEAHRVAARLWAEEHLAGASPFDTAADRVRTLVAR